MNVKRYIKRIFKILGRFHTIFYLPIHEWKISLSSGVVSCPLAIMISDISILQKKAFYACCDRPIADVISTIFSLNTSIIILNKIYKVRATTMMSATAILTNNINGGLIRVINSRCMLQMQMASQKLYDHLSSCPFYVLRLFICCLWMLNK